MQGEKFKNHIKAEGKVVIVTGSNTGIGKETALELARRKATVYLACRDLTKCEEARKSIILETKNRNVYCRELDLASFQSIKNFVKHFKAEQVRIVNTFL
jgi:retinol dehydrogenase 13